MSSKADKLRGKLKSGQRDRQDFEKTKKKLEEQVSYTDIYCKYYNLQMAIGRDNMDKIQKGLKMNDISVGINNLMYSIIILLNFISHQKLRIK